MVDHNTSVNQASSISLSSPNSTAIPQSTVGNAGLSSRDAQRAQAAKRKVTRGVGFGKSKPPKPKTSSLMNWLKARNAVSSIGGGLCAIDGNALTPDEREVLVQALATIYGRKIGASDAEIASALTEVK